MSLRRLLYGIFLSLLAVMLISTAVVAQEETPKAELFVGYQWLHPGGHGAVAVSACRLLPCLRRWATFLRAAGASFTYNFTSALGTGSRLRRQLEQERSRRIRYRSDRASRGAMRVSCSSRTPCWATTGLTVPAVDSSNGIGAILGGGMDLNLWRRLSLRLFEADYVWAHHNFSDEVSSRHFRICVVPTLEGVRLRTGSGFQLRFPNRRWFRPRACSIQPSEVMVGEPVTATATASNFNPKHTLTYSWTSTGGKVTSKDNTATIDTNGVAGGSYTVTARVTDPKMKKGGEASCTATFTVKEPPKNPPTMSCSANPTSVQAGTPATVTCTCTSPDNVPVTVSGWTASGGSVSGERRHRHSQHHRSVSRSNNRKRHLHRLSRPDRLGFEPGRR